MKAVQRPVRADTRVDTTGVCVALLVWRERRRCFERSAQRTAVSGGVRIRVNGTLTAMRSALGNAEEVSDDTDEIFAAYARLRSAVNVSH